MTKVQFSGGEPLLMRGFHDVVAEIDTAKVRVHIATNGYPLQQPTVERLAEARVHKLSVSLDGGAAAHHDVIRRKEGAFSRTLGGIERAVAAGLRVGVSSTVTPLTIDSLEVLVQKLVIAGVEDVSFHSVVPVGRAIAHPELMFSPERAGEFDEEVGRLRTVYGKSINVKDNMTGNGTNGRQGCPAQDRLLHIEPNGDVSPCSWLYKIQPSMFRLGNITEDSLLDIVARRSVELELLREQVEASCIIPAATERARAS
ncbi:radical SAM protein [Arthrobacter sp. PAMC25284]|nr:radical SAM protein [Arthrobacter sp. PAMC25284]